MMEENYLFIPSTFTGFCNTDTKKIVDKNGQKYFYLIGYLDKKDNENICPICHSKMECNNVVPISLKHLPLGGTYTKVIINRKKYYCSKCEKTVTQEVAFKNENHHRTNELYNYIRDLLAIGNYTNTEIAKITGANRNLVKEIDLERLKEKYTIDGNELIKPEIQAKYLGTDEFKLHNGYKYATHIIDLESGHILWIQEGKKKKVVYDFMNHVSDEFMKNVIAVACDMNSDFEEAFKEKYPHIIIVFDSFILLSN